MTKTLNGLEFDPGFAPYILAFAGTVEYLYADINRFKNFSQKKLKFMQYHKKILDIFNNNIGFYVGCLMWAAYIKTQPEQKILSNHCLGKNYNEAENTAETDYLLQFVELFPKDMKYYLGQSYTFDENIIKILDVYKDFLILNEGFVKSEKNTDIKIPDSVKTVNAEDYKSQIEEVLTTGNLNNLLKYLPSII